MKKTLGLALVFIIALGAFLFFRRTTVATFLPTKPSARLDRGKSGQSMANPPPSSPAAGSKSTSQEVLKEATHALLPVTDHSLQVWDNSGELTDEVVTRYRLTNQQVTRLKDLKAECVQRMQAIDVANASVVISPDGKSVSITIKPDATAAKQFTEFYQDSLLQILGESNYADLAKYYDSPSMDDSMNAGLVDKRIDVQRVSVNEQGVQYHIKAESKLRVSPTGFPQAFNSKEVETTGSRENLAVAYSGIDNLLPNNF